MLILRVFLSVRIGILRFSTAKIVVSRLLRCSLKCGFATFTSFAVNEIIFHRLRLLRLELFA